MIKTLLLCFIHGFKGDEETFYQFPEDLQKQVASTCSGLDVQTRVYPRYETRGDLAACVETFREWLQEQVTDIEQNAGTPSAILNPSVGVILCAHSMGGLVATDTLFHILTNRPTIPSPNPRQKPLFPLPLGLLSFDTPYNGLSRSMFAYGAFSQYQSLSSAWSLLSSVSSLTTSSLATKQLASQSVSKLGTETSTVSEAGKGGTSWKRWGLLASRTGTYGAIIAGGVAAYVHRDTIRSSLSKINRENLSSLSSINYREKLGSINYKDNISQGLTYVSRESIGEGFTWMASHLKFVGALMKTNQLTTRLERLSGLEGIGVSNFYTTLGDNGYWTGGYFVPKRTFCAIPPPPKEEEKENGIWIEQLNKKVGNEIEAHCSMFRPEKNSGYQEMLVKSVELVVQWTKNEPREVKDEYMPSKEQLVRSKSESELWDDDGKVKEKSEKEFESNGENVTSLESEDEMQLQAILKSQDMPEPEDGGVDDEILRLAAEVPLPVDEQPLNETPDEI